MRGKFIARVRLNEVRVIIPRNAPQKDANDIFYSLRSVPIVSIWVIIWIFTDSSEQVI